MCYGCVMYVAMMGRLYLYATKKPLMKIKAIYSAVYTAQWLLWCEYLPNKFVHVCQKPWKRARWRIIIDNGKQHYWCDGQKNYQWHQGEHVSNRSVCSEEIIIIDGNKATYINSKWNESRINRNSVPTEFWYEHDFSVFIDFSFDLDWKLPLRKQIEKRTKRKIKHKKIMYTGLFCS